MVNWDSDKSKTGSRTTLKDHEELAMRFLWENPSGVTSQAVWLGVKSKSPEPITRATIINFVETMREAGVLKGVETTFKGGHRWIYKPSLTEAEFREWVAK